MGGTQLGGVGYESLMWGVNRENVKIGEMKNRGEIEKMGWIYNN